MVAERYRLQRKVGGGRVAAMWRVQDEVTDITCVVKLLHRSMHKHAEALTRFSLEDRLAKELTGPHFPERVGSGIWDGMRYIAWRWHEGESLRALFERNPKQDAPTVHSIVQETCRALAAVHAAGYTHGDLKPENLFFADRGDTDSSRQLKLIGFGVASRLSRPAVAGAAPRKPGHIVGTPLYLSRDLILGRVPKGGQADLWALAVIVYEALTGRAPFLGNDLEAVLQAILDKQAPRPSSVADNLPGTFDLWWAQALEQEFGTTAEFATSLARALAPVLRTSHTQRSASLPDRLPAVLDSITPANRASLAELAGPSITAAGIGPTDLSGGRAAKVTAPEAATAKVAAPEAATAKAATAKAATAKVTPPEAATAKVTAPEAATARAATAQVTPEAATAKAATAKAATAKVAAPEAAAPKVAAAAAAAPADAPPSSTFAPLPSPLRDFASGISRKTLVGITPPASLAASSLRRSGNTSANSSPAPSIAIAAPASIVMSGAIEGTPIKRIDVSSEPTLEATASSSFEGMRRPSNPTVPFPRPRFLPRSGPMPSEDTSEIGGSPPARSWSGSTTHTLRLVLTSADHKPQRIAGLVVCAAAALVIFLAGRSPVAGTAAIGQATRALSAEPGPATPATPAITTDTTDPASDPAVPANALAPLAELTSEGNAVPGSSPLVREDKLEPGLVATPELPAAPNGPPAASRGAAKAPIDQPPKAASGNVSSKAGRSAPRATPQRTPPRKPARAQPLPRKPSGEIDFGI